MNEKQVVSQLKSLRKIQPSKDWAVLVKRDLMTRSFELKESPEKTGFGEAVFSLFARPAFMASSLVFVGCAIVGTFAYFGLQKKNYDLQAYINNNLSFQDEKNQQAVAGLTEVQDRMEEVKSILTSLKTTSDSKKALTATEAVKNTVKNSQKAIDQIKNSNTDLSKQTLASLGKVKETSLELEKTSADLQADILKAYLGELKTKNLSEQDKERLNKAEEYFNNGKTEEAIILLVRIGENPN